MPDDYDVGYGKPPRQTRFEKGKSGNPRGRPKRARNLKTELAEELSESILVREGAAAKRISKRRAMLKALLSKALQGDTRAATLVVTMVLRLLEGESERVLTDTLGPEDLAILDAYARQLSSAPGNVSSILHEKIPPGIKAETAEGALDERASPTVDTNARLDR